ncbi:putative ribonuclease mrp protein subunit rmp1 [Erysiphe neolycopersici]|uniref:Putative ribonuclease mrp protein subunit rmp1 n=1 Tax=Erysiphe neolycopersici TaxID=212602 RepID=A0A420I115_9PEZI|nr:putative ribonuclease mrp protein subunit rmp1 [Erysiphe neolycopersici]
MEDDIYSTSLQRLQEISYLLHLAHHRNKNQHRVARWYKFFGQLRRQIAKLILELDAFTTALKMMGITTRTRIIITDLIKSNKYLAVAHLKIDQRTEFMQLFLVPKCHLAFENLIADNQYAVLGLMLMGLLANLNDILPMLPSKNIEENPVIIDTEPNNIKKNAVRDTQLNDLGEIISRQEFKARHQECDNQEKIGKKSIAVMSNNKQRVRNLIEEPRNEETKSHPNTKSRKKKTKKGDIFDDIFKKLV